MKAALFDLDGTLVDSAPDIQAAANAVLAAEGLQPLGAAETRHFIGAGAASFVARMAAARLPAPDAGREAEMLAAFLDRYEGAVTLTRPYPGVVALLQDLARAGWALGVVTNKPAGPARAVLAHLELAGFFSVLVGGDSLPRRKPDPAPLRHALAALGAPVAVFVGDSEIDAAAAAAAGLPFALFTEGYRRGPAEAMPHALAFSDHAVLSGWLRARAAG